MEVDGCLPDDLLSDARADYHTASVFLITVFTVFTVFMVLRSFGLCARYETRLEWKPSGILLQVSFR